jgi:hypothetical protein
LFRGWLPVVPLTGAVVGYMPFSSRRRGYPDIRYQNPAGIRDWRPISVAHEEGNPNDLRPILGNDLAIKAYREGELTAQSSLGSVNSTTANPPTRRCSTSAFPATSQPKLATLS